MDLIKQVNELQKELGNIIFVCSNKKQHNKKLIELEKFLQKCAVINKWIYYPEYHPTFCYYKIKVLDYYKTTTKDEMDHLFEHTLMCIRQELRSTLYHLEEMEEHK